MDIFLLSDVGALPITVGAATVLGSGLILALGWAARRSKGDMRDSPPRPKPVSIETELQRDVKGKWKRHKQPFIYKS